MKPLPPIRRLIQPDPGYILVDADLKGADAQIVAWEAGAERLKAIFRARRDPYVEAAKGLWGGTIDKPQRQLMKAGVHLSNYAGKGRTLASTLGVPITAAEQMQDHWFSEHPEIALWHKKIELQLRLTREITNVWGFKRRYFDRSSANLLPQATAWLGQCVLTNHQVLTKDGWRIIEQVMNTESEIAVWDSRDSTIRFERPETWSTHWTSTLVHLPELGYWCTPNHRIPYFNAGRTNVKVGYADTLPKEARVPVVGKYIGGRIDFNSSVITLMAAFQADGWYDAKRDSLQFEFKRERKINRLEEALRALNADYTKTIVRRGATMFYVKNASKFVNPDWKRYRSWLLNLSRSSLDNLLSEIGHWDGSVDPRANVIWYFQNDKEDCEWIATIAVMSGARVRWFDRSDDRRKNVGYRLTYTFTRGKTTTPTHIKQEHTIMQKVACPTVSTGFFLLRNNDFISVTGNSGVAGTINKAMLQIRQQLPEVQLLLQVHDSLLMQIPIRRFAPERIIAAMSVRVPFKDPLIIPVELKYSLKSWGEMTEWKPDEEPTAAGRLKTELAAA